jgi:hypothetical protein
MAAPYKNLVAWRRADDLFIEVHRLTHLRFPKYEKYELGSQLRSCVLSSCEHRGRKCKGAPG